MKLISLFIYLLFLKILSISEDILIDFREKGRKSEKERKRDREGEKETQRNMM